MAFKSQPTVTRPANVTPYTAGDVLGGAFQFTGLLPGQDILITSADLRINIGAIPTGMTSFRYYLYNATPPSALADNAAFDLPAGDRANFLGYVDAGSPVLIVSTLFCEVEQVNKHTRPGNTGIWCYMVTNGGFTPAANSEVYVPTLYGVILL